MRPSVRLAALMELPVTYVWTHDSIGLGEDGPTHQPIEHVWALRAIPGLEVIRPGDANETVIAWRTILERARPAALCLTRQNLPVLDRSGDLASAEGVARGGYVLAGGSDAILIATGSEVSIALEAREQLAADGVSARVVSMPCVEWFNDQDESYRREVLPVDHPRTGVGRGGHYRTLALVHRRCGRFNRSRPLRRIGRLQEALPGVRHHRGAGSRRRTRQSGPGQGLTRHGTQGRESNRVS